MAAPAVELVQSFRRTEKSLFINSILPPWHSCSRGRRAPSDLRPLCWQAGELANSTTPSQPSATIRPENVRISTRLVGSDPSTGIGAKKVVAVLAFSNQRYGLGLNRLARRVCSVVADDCAFSRNSIGAWLCLLLKNWTLTTKRLL